MLKSFVRWVKRKLFPYRPEPMSPRRKYIAKLWLWQGAETALNRIEQIEIINRLHHAQLSKNVSKELAC
jgi:hypothetical protein